MANSANPLYIAIVSDAEPQSIWRTHAIAEGPSRRNAKGIQLFDSSCLFNSCHNN